VRAALQENNAESALDALKEMQSEHAKTMRDGKLVRPAAQLLRCARGASRRRVGLV